MSSYRSLKFYITKFGDEVGRTKYAAVLVERERRERRKNGKSIKSLITLDTDDDKLNAIAKGDAVKCEECGYVGTRLQHTHFKYNCSGKFKSGTEYKAAYPGCVVVAPNLAKKTSGTLANYVLLHGEEEGLKKWNEYKQKQAHSNSFEYKQKKHGWGKGEFDEYNSSRKSTLQMYVSRHGEHIGHKMWDTYTERQRYTTSRQYFIEEYGEEQGEERYDAFHRARCTTSGKNQSNVELDCYSELVKHIPALELSVEIAMTKYYKRYDYGSVEYKKMIEFNGTYWHADPRKYGPDYFHNKKLITAKQIWEYDATKLSVAHQYGYNTFVIWEMDWKSDSNAVISKVINWWNNETNCNESSC